MATTDQHADQFEIGDWVAFRFGIRDLFAQIIEKRGPLGVNARRIYAVRVYPEPGEPDSFEMPENALRRATPTSEQIMDYLSNGGLVEILRTNASGGKNPPAVWLTFSPRGGLSHTFEPARGLAGGAAPPFFALHGEKVFAVKVGEVEKFLQSFGLTPHQAAQVLSNVGTQP